MKNIFITLISVLLSTTMMAQESTEMMDWEAYATPSSVHQFLARYDGKWKTTIKIYMDPQNPQPVISTGISTTNMILGGRYQVTEMDGSIGGMTTHGISTLAFDNAKQEFINSWMDDSGTGMTIMYGIWHDDTQKQIDFEGNMVNPESGEEIFIREEFVFVDDDTQKMSMWADYGGGEVLSMELLFERIKE